MDKRIDLLFRDDETGEFMFVELDRKDFKSERKMIEFAQTKLCDYMDTPEFCGFYTVAEAEILGYDTVGH